MQVTTTSHFVGSMVPKGLLTMLVPGTDAPLSDKARHLVDLVPGLRSLRRVQLLDGALDKAGPTEQYYDA